MPDFLTRRNGTWHLVRRVPAEFAAFDTLGLLMRTVTAGHDEFRDMRRA